MTFHEERPIFLQLAEQLEEGILSGAYPEESQVPSITEYSATYKINPATALKGINLLVDQGLLYKKRGVGMFVSTGAREKLRERRREDFYHDYVERRAWKLKAMIQKLMRLPGFYRLVPDIFAKGTRKMFGETAGFAAVEHETNKNVWRIDMVKCPYHDTCVE